MGRAITEAFIRLYNSGLISRSTRLTSWCCALQSALSDMEVDSLEVNGRTQLRVPGYSQRVEFGLMYEIDYIVEGMSE